MGEKKKWTSEWLQMQTDYLYTNVADTHKHGVIT